MPGLEVSRTIIRDPDLSVASSRTRIFNGRSIAILGEAIIREVPAFGLPKISSLLGGIFMPALAASPL